MVVDKEGLGRCQDAQLTGGEEAPGVTFASFTTPRSRFFRQPQSSHVNKQMLVFYSLVHSGERGKTYPRVAGGNGMSTHVTYSDFFPSSGLEEKREHVCVLVVGYRSGVSLCVCLLLYIFVGKYLCFRPLVVIIC